MRRPKRLPSLPPQPPSSVISFTIYPLDKRRLRLPDSRKSGLLSQSLYFLPLTQPGSPVRGCEVQDGCPAMAGKLGFPRPLFTRVRTRRVIQSRMSRQTGEIGFENGGSIEKRCDFDLTPWASDSPATPPLVQ